jgi:urea carboxylase-associated protein 2
VIFGANEPDRGTNSASTSLYRPATTWNRVKAFDEQKRTAIEASRKSYGELQAAGQKQATSVLPARTAPNAPPIPGDALLLRETIPGGWYWTSILSLGEILRIATPSGRSSVSLVAWNKAGTSERINYADTMKVQWTAALQKGRVLLSDMGRVLFSITEDTSFAHDALCGGSTRASNLQKYGKRFLRNTRDNFTLAAAKHGLRRSDVPPCITFFAPVSVGENTGLRWDEGQRKPGDFVDLRAEMPLIAALSNCPHPLDPGADYAPEPIEVAVFRPSAAVNEFQLYATAEAKRAFENTHAYLSMRGFNERI